MKLEGVANVRDLGGIKTISGKTVKSNLLFRSANLSKASENDVKQLQGQNLKLVCDLRTETERSSAMDVEIPGVENIWFNVLGQLPQKTDKPSSAQVGLDMVKIMNPNTFSPEVAVKMIEIVKSGIFDGMMENVYVGLVAREHPQKEYARMFNAILKTQGGTILWHCSQGKDRAGLTAAFILFALGVDEKTVMEDFNKSNESYQSMIDAALQFAKSQNLSEQHQGVIKAILGVNPDYLHKALDFIKANFGSMQKYMELKLGLTEDKIQKLKEYYLQ